MEELFERRAQQLDAKREAAAELSTLEEQQDEDEWDQIMKHQNLLLSDEPFDQNSAVTIHSSSSATERAIAEAKLRLSRSPTASSELEVRHLIDGAVTACMILVDSI